MSTLRVNKLENTNTSNGGISIDTSGHVSIDGQQLPSSGPLSNRNLIINGAMQVAQRGTGNFAITADDYPVDRFLFSNAGTTSGNANGTQSTTTPPGFKNSLEVDVTATDTSLNASAQYKIEHRIEGQNVAHLNWGTANAKTVTLSFYIKSNKTGETAVALLNDGNDRAYVATFDINAANTWEQKTLTISGPTDGTWLDTNGIGIRLRWGTYGSNFQTSSTNQWVSSQVMTSTSAINFFDDDTNNLFLTGVQLEVGETATPFEHRSYNDELARCQRYFHTIANSANHGIVPMAAYTSTAVYGLYKPPVEMCSSPVLVEENVANGLQLYGNNASAQNINGNSINLNTARSKPNVVRMEVTSGISVTQGYAYWLEMGSSATFVLGLDAEL